MSNKSDWNGIGSPLKILMFWRVIFVCYDVHKMRTTLTIDDKTARALKDIAHRSGKTYKQVVNETLQTGLSANNIRDMAKPYRLKPVSMGEVTGSYNLTKALALADYLEEEEIARKLELKK